MTNSNRLNREAPCPQKKRAVGAGTPTAQENNPTNAIMAAIAGIREVLLDGRSFRLIDIPEDRRAAAVAALAALRDELPIRRRWRTIRESFRSETRLRAAEYSIDGAFLREGGSL